MWISQINDISQPGGFLPPEMIVCGGSLRIGLWWNVWSVEDKLKNLSTCLCLWSTTFCSFRKIKCEGRAEYFPFLIPSVVSSNTACLPLQRPCNFEDMVLFSHKFTGVKINGLSWASSGLKTYKEHRASQCQDFQERQQAPWQLSQPDRGSRYLQQ